MEKGGILVFYTYDQDDAEVSGPDKIDGVITLEGFKDYMEYIKGDTLEYYDEFINETSEDPDNITPIENIFFYNEEELSFTAYHPPFTRDNDSHTKHRFFLI